MDSETVKRDTAYSEMNRYRRKYKCTYCDDTGYLDYAGFRMDLCTFC